MSLLAIAAMLGHHHPDMTLRAAREDGQSHSSSRVTVVLAIPALIC
jgi:hypothetical protein